MEIKITDTAKSKRGWVTVSKAAKYAGVSKKTFDDLLRNHGLPFVSLPSGHRRVCLDDIDLWYRQRQNSTSVADEILKNF